jgi:lysyl-tRNA synthetase, class I
MSLESVSGSAEDSSTEIIGRGTWLDRVAKEIVEREKTLGRSLDRIRVESGLGASGIPHIGSIGDAARAFGVKLALEEAGFHSELIAYSDDMDALRKVPAGMPDWLQNDIGKPVSEIRDPFDCHHSYGEHMSSLLRDGLDKLGVKYTFQSGYKSYKAGLLVNQIKLILENAELIGQKIEELTGQKKYLESIPYFPQCENCRRLNVARPYRFEPSEMKVYYRCTGDEIGRKWVEGCGHKGFADIRKGEGKLPWKVEFAARWSAFDIRYEALGKELIDSVRINDWIADNVLNFLHPYHVVYELFQDKSGKKISKSVGNLVSPQKWVTLASPQSLMLVYFKRIVGARNISEEDVPLYMDEYDQLEDLYFGKVKESNPLKDARLKGLYYYSNLAHPSERPPQHVSYRLLVEIAKVAPPDNPVEYIQKRLITYREIKEVDEDVLKMINYALNWAREYSLEEAKVKLTPEEKKAIFALSEQLSPSQCEPDAVQTMIFDTAKSLGLKPATFFRALYLVLLGMEKGPRLGPYVADAGCDKIAEKLRTAAQN